MHFAEEWNELHHLQIMESLGGERASCNPGLCFSFRCPLLGCRVHVPRTHVCAQFVVLRAFQTFVWLCALRCSSTKHANLFGFIRLLASMPAPASTPVHIQSFSLSLQDTCCSMHVMLTGCPAGDQLWIDRFMAQHAAIVYYIILVLLFVFSPKLAYNFSELIEAHAVDTYGESIPQGAHVEHSCLCV